ncbi:monoamine oxidase N [Plenodomus tracheiphilus IPT5]|uniref:Amine oxidase n=1 Tax=Plenodomus tracheiphilus IPT5 TaxID=1408161 RepID=A0A6A7AW52_9PLEO|nr:monoamine oxidase N [Plenodomus tracheiphilus IPT5]
MTSRDGYCWTPQGGLQAGVPTIGLISPPTNITNQEDIVYDVVIIGAGYCGLTAARDASLEGLKVLLLEGRDRIGGRSWSSNIGGYPFEMGGTWVHWGQSNTWREIMRYEMNKDVESSFDFSRGVNHFELNMEDSSSTTMSHDKEDELLASALNKFTNIDGVYGRKTIPLPHDTFHTPSALALDKISAQDRIDEIASTLTPQERVVLEASILLASGGTLATTSFHEFMHWWAMCGYTYQGWLDMLITWKFSTGQSSFAIKFFNEAVETGRCDYAFNTPIAHVHDKGSTVDVTTRDGRSFHALKAICTVPLNVLSDMHFTPPLSPGKLAAIKLGNINHTTKIHAELSNKDMRSWTGITFPHNELHYAIGDGTTPAGNTHIVCFGGDNKPFHPEDDIPKTKHAITSLFHPKHYTTASQPAPQQPPTIERIVFHNWNKDEFSKGAWFFSPPGLLSGYLEDLRRRQGNVVFASSDWAVGWRSFIDGAIEEGGRAAREVRREVLGGRVRVGVV